MDVAKVLPDIIRLTEEAARANSEASERLRKVLEDLEPGVRGVRGEQITDGDEVNLFGEWRPVEASYSCQLPACWLLILSGNSSAIHIERGGFFRVRRACPPECEGDIHRWPCPIADEIATAMEWERGA